MCCDADTPANRKKKKTGISYVVLENPKSCAVRVKRGGDRVLIHYKAMLPDGHVFQTTYKVGRTLEVVTASKGLAIDDVQAFPDHQEAKYPRVMVDQPHPWKPAIIGMCVGEIRRVTVARRVFVSSGIPFPAEDDSAAAYVDYDVEVIAVNGVHEDQLAEDELQPSDSAPAPAISQDPQKNATVPAAADEQRGILSPRQQGTESPPAKRQGQGYVDDVDRDGNGAGKKIDEDPDRDRRYLLGSAKPSAGKVVGGFAPKADRCDSCRATVEEFYHAWMRVTYKGVRERSDLAQASGGHRPSMTYDEQTEDMVQHLCERSDHIRKLSKRIGDGCNRLMKRWKRLLCSSQVVAANGLWDLLVM
ncbi:hypothetical protein CBR_g19865 [Chara braunii]|uniref:Rotamase n=1 Tax=Chara braunii TaxID=69332 RepID=A0A388KYV2_CHABU|nr:hypothetical protein CBR_g19865 [Chara braunii]|eukprot:GBG75229.1 hypothetical protein CBR_g19865 [Chara braunii]